MCNKLKTSTKKAARGGNQAARNNELQSTLYQANIGSSRKFLPTFRKIPRRSSNRFEQRRQQVIQGLLAASAPAEKIAIQRGLAEGKVLREAVEGL